MTRRNLALATTFSILFLVSEARAASFNDLSTFLSAAGSTTLIDFETDGAGNTPVDLAPLGSEFASLGITFDSGNTFVIGFFQPVSGDWGWLSDEFVAGDVVFGASFASGVRAVGVHNVFNGSVPNGGRLDAYDSADNLIASVLSDTDGNTLDFFGVTTGVDIARFTITAITPTGWGLDDLYFSEVGAAPIPEPTSVALFGVGTLLVGARLRRARAR
jgi:hypothetical protein